MPQGTFTLFEEFSKTLGDGSHKLDTDSFKVMLITEQVGGTPSIAPPDASPDSSNYTEVTGTGYIPGGAEVVCSWTEANGTSTFQVTSGNTTWAQDASGPTNIKTALLYNINHVGLIDAIGFMDITVDGVTAVSMQTANIDITWNPVLFTVAKP